WDLGYVLDMHIISSTHVGNDEYGRARFETTRTEVGEAVHQLKYRHDQLKVGPLADELVKVVKKYFKGPQIVSPMPPSKARPIQPVSEIAKKVAEKLGIKYRDNVLIKSGTTPQMKDLKSNKEK